MSTRTTYMIWAIAACVYVFLLIFPNFWLAWASIIAWGIYLYALHENMSLSQDPKHATTYMLIAGGAIVVAFSLLGALYAFMSATAVLLVLGLRKILPKHFPVETYGEAQQPE